MNVYEVRAVVGETATDFPVLSLEILHIYAHDKRRARYIAADLLMDAGYAVNRFGTVTFIDTAEHYTKGDAVGART